MISKVKDSAVALIQQYQKCELTKNDADRQVGAPSSVTEKVILSTRAKDIQHIRQIIEQIPDVREDNVLELKRQIESGNYRINSEKIAENIMSESFIDLFE